MKLLKHAHLGEHLPDADEGQMRGMEREQPGADSHTSLIQVST